MGFYDCMLLLLKHNRQTIDRPTSQKIHTWRESILLIFLLQADRPGCVQDQMFEEFLS